MHEPEDLNPYYIAGQQFSPRSQTPFGNQAETARFREPPLNF